jgi:AsmA protein
MGGDMLRIVKWISLIVLGLVVVAVALVLIVPNVIDWNRYKPEIASAVRQATGRDMQIDGDIKLSVSSDLSFSVTGLRLANAPGLTPPEMLRLGSVTGKVALWPLIRRELRIDSLIVNNAAVHLAINKDGHPNWVFQPAGTAAEQPASPRAAPEPGGGSGLTVRLGDFRLEGSQVTYQDATTGQTLDVRDIAFATAMADPARPLSVAGQMTVNAEPVTLDVLLDSPARLLGEEKAAAKLKLASRRINMTYAGSLQQRPIPGLDGVFDLDVASVGQLASWLGRPLEKSQPDPGALKVHAEFAADGPKVLIKDVTVAGTALNAKASGSLDASGKAPKLVLQVQSNTLDIDRYLPPAPKAKAVPATQAPARAGSADLFSAVPNDPIDLGWMQAAEVDVNVAVAGIKAAGYEVGRVAAEAQAKAGVLTAEIKELSLYGGKITGSMNLDGKGKELAVQSALKVERVKLDDLARAASAGALPVTGVASASLDASAQGGTPRALAESLRGKLALDLGGMEVKNAAAGAISGIKLALNLPGGNQQPTLDGSVVYNKQPVDIALKLDALKNVASAKRFTLTAAVKSELATVRYDGSVIVQPAPGLDGKFDLDVGSFGKLAAWLGTPLPASQPDPGPIKVAATFAGEGAKMSLKDATIEGKALKAKASGEIDHAQKVPALNASLEITSADLNAYFPPPPATQASAGAKPAGTPSGQAAQAGWSDAPLELSALSTVNGEVVVKVASTRYRELSVERGTIKTTMTGGVVKTTLEKISLAKGTIDGSMTLDGANPAAAKLTYQIAVSGVESQDLLKSFAGSDRLSGKLDFKTNATGSGRSQKQIIESLNGTGEFKFLDGAIHGINFAEAVRQVRTLGTATSQSEKTDFAELSGTYTIKNGILENKDLKMLAPLIRLSGEGTIDMPKQTIDYRTEAKLVGTIQGQGGEQGLSGLPIPVKITGPWTAPSYQIDWQSVLQEAAKDPARLQQLPGQLKGMGKGMNIPGLTGAGSGGGGLPSPGLGSSGSSSSGSGAVNTGNTSQPAQKPSSGGTGNILKSIPGFSPQ